MTSDQAEAGSGAPDRRMPPVDFQTFLISLASSALVHLGEVENPETGTRGKDLVLAKHTLEVLSMLEQKTRGNRTEQEEKLLGSLLYDLRLRYVEASKAP